MIPKQREMDGIVNQVYEAISTKAHLESALLVLLGDHGMNDGGNHGGSSPGETSPALVFISPKFKSINQGSQSPALFEENFQYYSTIEQSDIAATLGALLGFPIPRNNLGAFIPEFLPFWSKSMARAPFHTRATLILKQIATESKSCYGTQGKYLMLLQLLSLHSKMQGLQKTVKNFRAVLMSSHASGEASYTVYPSLDTKIKI